MKQIVEIEPEARLDGETPYGIDLITFTRVVEGHRELYGSDADGNRGRMTSMIDDDRAEKITLNNGTMPYATLGADVKGYVDDLIDVYLKENEPEEEEEREDDRFDTEQEREDYEEDLY